MIKREFLLLVLLLARLLGASQEDTTLRNGSIVLINEKQYAIFDSITVAGIESDYIDLQECTEINQHLNKIVDTMWAIILLRGGRIASLEKENDLKDQQLEQSDAFIEGLHLHIKNQDKEAKKQRIAHTVKEIVIPTLVGVVSGAAGYFIGKYGKDD